MSHSTFPRRTTAMGRDREWRRALLPGGAACAILALLTVSACTYESVPSLPCKIDADCNDSLACNGVEVCEQGSCVRGSAVTCDSGLGCVEPGDLSVPAICAPVAESRWLVYSTHNVSSDVAALFASNVAAGFDRKPVRVDVGFGTSETVVLGSAAWSPNGRYLTFQTIAAIAEERPRSGVYAVDMSGPVPGKPVRIVDSGVSFRWAPNSARLIVSDSVDSLYSVEFAQQGPRPAVLVASHLSAAVPLGGSPFDDSPNLVDVRFRWSPGSDRIAYKAGKLFIVSVSGSAASAVEVSGKATGVAGYAWSPDGKYLLFAAGLPEKLYLVRENNLLRDLASPSLNGLARWSPDSSAIAFVENGQTALTKDVISKLPAISSTPGAVSWAPDSSALAVTSLSAPARTIVSLPSRSITNALRYSLAANGPLPGWSPRGKYFALLTSNASPPLRELVLLDAKVFDKAYEAAPNTGTAPPATVVDSAPNAVDGEISYQFAPDDSALAYVLGPQKNQGVYLYELDDTPRVVALAQGKTNARPSFSSAAGYLAFSSELVSGSATTAGELAVVPLGKQTTPKAVSLVSVSDGVVVSDVAWQPR